MSELSYIELPYLDLTSNDNEGNTKQYRVYNTLDYAIRVGFVLQDEHSVPELLVPIQWYGYQDPKVRENELDNEHYLDEKRVKDAVDIANKLRHLLDEDPNKEDLKVTDHIGDTRYYRPDEGWKELVPTRHVEIAPYGTYSAKDRFLVPMDTFLEYELMCSQSHRIYESLVCTYTKIPSYKNLPAVNRTEYQVYLQKLHNLYTDVSTMFRKYPHYLGTIALEWDEYKDGFFIFGNHEN